MLASSEIDVFRIASYYKEFDLHTFESTTRGIRAWRDYDNDTDDLSLFGSFPLNKTINPASEALLY